MAQVGGLFYAFPGEPAPWGQRAHVPYMKISRANRSVLGNISAKQCGFTSILRKLTLRFSRTHPVISNQYLSSRARTNASSRGVIVASRGLLTPTTMTAFNGRGMIT